MATRHLPRVSWTQLPVRIVLKDLYWQSMVQGTLHLTERLGWILHNWAEWANPTEVASWFQPLIQSDEALPIILEKHLLFGASSSGGDLVSARTNLLEANQFKAFVNLDELANRARAIQNLQLTPKQRVAVETFLASCEDEKSRLPATRPTIAIPP